MERSATRKARRRVAVVTALFGFCVSVYGQRLGRDDDSGRGILNR